MAQKIRFELNKSGVRELLQSEEAKAVCKSYADDIRSRAGAGFEVDTYTGRNRVNAMVYADTPEAYQECLDDNTLLRAVR